MFLGQKRLDNVGRKQRQALDAGHIGACDPLSLGQFRHRGKLSRLGHELQPERTCQ